MILDLIDNAISYFPYSLILFFCTLFLPALAFYPALLRTPFLATTIPIVSILIVNLIAIILINLQIYQQSYALCIIASLSVFSFFRIFLYLKHHSLVWDNNDKYLLLVNFSLMLPLIALAGISVFMTNDALSSWNFWATIMYHGSFPSMSGYPPFFPIFLSFCYQLLGTTEYQGAVKVLLFIFPFTLLNAFAFCNNASKKFPLFYLVIASICIIPGFLTFGFYRFYAIGYADPLLAAATVVAMMQLLKYLETEEIKYFYLTIVTSVTAALSKQPGMLWACFLFFIIVYKTYSIKKIIWQEWLGIGILLFAIFLWLLNGNTNFYQNQGVITASLHQSHITFFALMNTFFHSFLKYLILQPTLLTLFILAGIITIHSIYQRLIYCIFILIATILWFLFGSYEIRLGLYILSSLGLLILWNEHLLHNFLKRLHLPLIVLSCSIKNLSQISLGLGIILFINFSIFNQINAHVNVPNKIFPLQAGRSLIYHYFGDQADFIYMQLYNNAKILLLAPQPMMASIFYGHTPLTPNLYNLDAHGLYRMIQQYHPAYLLVTFCDRKTDMCDGVNDLMQKYPGLLFNIPMHGAKYGARIFKIKQ